MLESWTIKQLVGRAYKNLGSSYFMPAVGKVQSLYTKNIVCPKCVTILLQINFSPAPFKCIKLI